MTKQAKLDSLFIEHQEMWSDNGEIPPLDDFLVDFRSTHGAIVSNQDELLEGFYRECTTNNGLD